MTDTVDPQFTSLPREIASLIVNHAVVLGKNPAEMFGIVTRVCRVWYDTLDRDRLRYRYENHLRILLKLFPDKPWAYEWIYSNPNIPADVICLLPGMLEFALKNPNITWEHVKDHRELQYSWARWNPNATLEDFRRIRRDLVQCSPIISKHITWEIIVASPDICWNFDWVSAAPFITMRVVLDNPDKPWNYKKLSSNPSISWDDVVTNPDLPWDDVELSRNPSIHWDVIVANPDIRWNFTAMSERITWEVVAANPKLPWNYKKLSANPNVTWEIVSANPDKPWKYSSMSANPNLTWEIIRDNITQPWDFCKLSANEFNHARRSSLDHRPI